MGCPAGTVTPSVAGCSFPVSTVLPVRVTVAGVKLSDPASHAPSLHQCPAGGTAMAVQGLIRSVCTLSLDPGSQQGDHPARLQNVLRHWPDASL